GITAKGHVMETFRSYAKAFIVLVTRGFEAGKAAFQAAAKSASLAVDFLEDSSKLANYAARASKVLKIIAVVGIIADAFILAFALYAEAQQRTALRGAINDLFVRRIISKTQDGLMLSYLLFVTDQEVLPEDQAAADRIADRFIQYVTEDWAAIDSESCYGLLSDLDSSRNSWRNEDPSKASAIEQADKDVDIDNSANANQKYFAQSVVKMFHGENAAKVVRKIFIEGHGDPSGYDEKARGHHVSSQPHAPKWVEYMQEIAVSGNLNKQRILQVL
ncbi:hypothetical protein BD779DRAFT_1474857, partial [Infundibulicybe gibba]